MKNILFFEQFSNISGGQKVLLNILSGLYKENYKSYVVLPEKGELSKELERMSIKYYILPIGKYSAGKKSLFDMFNFLFRMFYLPFVTIRIIKDDHIDILYANAPRTFILAGIAGRWCRIPVIWHLHSILTGLNLKVVSIAAKWLANRIIAVSKAVSDPLISSERSLAGKINVVYNGIDAEPYEKQYNKLKLKEELGISPNDKVIGFIGQIAEWKGLDNFILSAKNVLRNPVNVTFIIAGDALFGDIEYKNKILADIKGFEKIKYIGQRKDIPELLNIIDIFVLPSIKPDPCPLILLEAMAAGKAILATNHGGASEIIKDKTDGFLYPANNANMLTHIILEMLNDQMMLETVGRTAHGTLTKDYNNLRFQNEINSILQETKE